MPRGPIAALCLLIGVALCGAGAEARDGATAKDPAAISARLARLGAVRSWGYQLRQIKVEDVAASSFDLVVVDYARARSRGVEHAFTPAEVERMRTRPDGTKRLVFSYLSIGEAEWYRYYWQPDWEADRLPPWIGVMNPAWYGNFPVRFWHEDWQRILFEPKTGYLDRILAAGFDGLYLDRVDVYEEFRNERPTARADMIALIEKIRREVDRRRPGTLIIQQNAEELLTSRRVLAAIDAVAKENLLYGLTEQHARNSAAEIAWSEKHLKLAIRAGRRVMAVEYIDEPALARQARRHLESRGFVATFAPKPLHVLPRVPVDQLAERAVWPPPSPSYGSLHAPRPDNY